ncbi:MAG: hypothetical protein PF450_05095 [Bacteroidales bacterium]|nr:hypothetical protein [Bacteroidales bacterium]
MKIWIKKTLFWVLAVVITLSASVYQRMTGPTYPIDIEINSGSENYSFDLPRSHGGETDCAIDIALPTQFSGEVIYRRFPAAGQWDTIQFHRVEGELIAFLPHQPPAGKLEYHINLSDNGIPVELNLEENIVVRFKGAVPAWALVPHIIFMFFAMLWSNATGIQAIAKIKSYKRNALITVILFTIGGLILGPIVQKFAFGAYWTGWPFGEDLTDNKVLVSVIVWVVALVLNQKKDRRWMVVIAALLLFAIYMIPHSMRGSELDYESGDVVTGSILLLATFSRSIFHRTRPLAE